MSFFNTLHCKIKCISCFLSKHFHSLGYHCLYIIKQSSPSVHVDIVVVIVIIVVIVVVIIVVEVVDDVDDCVEGDKRKRHKTGDGKTFLSKRSLCMKNCVILHYFNSILH